MIYRIICIFSLLILTACGAEEDGSLSTTFYHWETTLDPSPTARCLLDSFSCDRLYVKAFDLSHENGKLRTQAWLEMKDTTDLPELVPVVFITNEVFRRAAKEEIDNLADDLLQAIGKIFPMGYPELQFDCDWTAGTREKYFSFLRAVKSSCPNIMLSCTVRLHQYRDRAGQGIPPVDRGTLMAYNTGDLNDWTEENSIYDSTVVKNYLANQPAYPLDLDLAVAAYDWAAIYRRDKLVHLINEPNLGELKDTVRFQAYATRNSPRYYVKQSTYLDGLYLYEGDLLRREVMPPSRIDAQADLLLRYVKSFPGQRLMVYRLGSRVWE